MMGISMFLPFSAGERDQILCTSSHPLRHILLWTTLLFLVPVAGTSDVPKAVVNIEPPWINVLREDYVTLKCHGAHATGDYSTQWFHKGNPIPTQVQSSYRFKATMNHSGEYRCQTDQSSLSDPVQLGVFSEWLLLQTPHLTFQEGEPIVLRCHYWMNQPLYKVTFYQDGKAKKYFHTNSNFSIPQANVSHSGAYHCSGIVRNRYVSKPVTITVLRSNKVSSSLEVMVAAVVSGIVVLAIVVAIVTWFYLRQKRTSANFTDADEAAKAEAEKTITYSLLTHPDGQEEETGPTDYEKSA
ncbi:PREDICTED: low affinity immunoglobulin gamma Fc region receptor II-like [Chrysochloris asiatica]|uniref:low affinity immunoglobulin gamma Fc region receptor II-like n=1 Tax=Chrysochloris asiatica TaxID=185453 RepID=UPI0003F0FA3B|nr:PREDICTED: low affinity immunoglobulin gamma Fc region receptor II-like [Chrysochloris asiatica]